MALTQVDQGLLGTYAQYTGFKNRIINGAFPIAQRATTAALPTSAGYVSVDRWAFTNSNSASGIANQVSSGLAGFQYALKMGRNNGQTGTGYIIAYQAIETANSFDLAGQSVTISFWAKAGANYSSSGSTLGVLVVSGNGTDQSVSSMAAGTWTGQAYPVNSNATITTTWTKYTLTGTVSSSATQLGVELYYQPSGTAGADDNVYITGVQLEKGSTATSFDYRPYGTELALCQRYYEKSYDIGTALGTATYTGAAQGGTGSNNAGSTTYAFECYFTPFIVQKRAAPTMTGYDPQAGTSGQWQRFYTGVSPAGAATVSFDTIGYKGFRAVVSAGSAANCVLGQWTASAEL